MMRRFTFVLVLIIQANLPTSALAAPTVEYREHDESRITLTPEEQAWLEQHDTVQVRTFDWPPYMITRGGKPPEGIAVEYLKLIEKRSGISFDYEKSSTSFAEFLANMKRRQSPDMTSLIVPSPDREAYFSFTESYVSSPYVIFARVEDELILDINGLAGKVVAVTEGYTIQKKLAGDYPAIKLALYDSDEQCLNAVATGKADAFIGNLTVASHIIQRHGLTTLRVVAASPFGEQELSMGVRNDWPELTSIIDKTLASITEKEKTVILENYVSVQYKQGLEKARVLKGVLIFLAVLLGVISLFIVWNRNLSRRVLERTEQLSESEERYRALFEQNQVGIIFADTETRRFKYANLAAARMLGYTQEELCALGVEDIHPPEALDLVRREFEAQYKGEKGMIHALPCLRKDRSVIYADVSGQSINTSEGKFSIGIFTDITERRKAEEALQSSEENFRRLIDQTPLTIEVHSVDGKFLMSNRAYSSLTGLFGATLQAVHESFDLRHDEHYQRLGFGPLLERLYAGETVRFPVYEYNVSEEADRLGIPVDDAGPIWLHTVGFPLKDSAGRTDAVVLMTEDITTQKTAEKALATSEEKFRQLAQQSPLSIQIVKPDGCIEEVNQAFKEMWGIPEKDLPDVLENYNMLEDEEARKHGVLPAIKKAFGGEAVILPEIEYEAANTMDAIGVKTEANKVWIRSRFYPIKNDKGEVIRLVDIEEDITERKQAEQMLQAHQERLRALATTLTRTEERERRKIATELHDHVGQSLALMRIQLAAARNEGGGRKVGDMLDDVSESLREAIKDTRSIMYELSSPTLNELGLSAAIADWLKEKIEDRHGLQTCFEDDGEPKPLSDDTSAIAFRSVRELLMNVIKHANASRVTVNTRKQGHMLKIIVEDDGVGMPASTEREHKSDLRGFGLFSIMEHLNDLDGSLSIESTLGQGVRAILSIPLEDVS